MEWVELAGRPPAWIADGAAARYPFVVLTRLLCFRNFAGAPFPVSATPQALAALTEKALALLSDWGFARAWRLAECEPGALRVFRERQWLPDRPVTFPGKRDLKYLALSNDAHDGAAAREWFLLNEVELITRIRVFPSLPTAAFESLYSAPEENAARGVREPWAWSPSLGYLASDPGRAGPGCAVEMLVHLPGLALCRGLERAHNAMAALGIGFIPVSAPASPSALFWLKSRGGLGRKPEAVYQHFLQGVQPLLEWENQAQIRCREKEPKRLEDRVFKSLHLLAQARLLAYDELLALGSLVRLGAYAGYLNPQIPGILEELRVVTRPGHLKVSSGGSPSRDLPKEEEDILRANVVRLTLERARGSG